MVLYGCGSGGGPVVVVGRVVDIWWWLGGGYMVVVGWWVYGCGMVVVVSWGSWVVLFSCSGEYTIAFVVVWKIYNYYMYIASGSF